MGRYRGINWAINFDITLDDKKADFKNLTETEQEYIFSEIKDGFYSGTFIGDEENETCSNGLGYFDGDLYEQDLLEQFCKIMKLEGRESELDEIENMEDVMENYKKYGAELEYAQTMATALQNRGQNYYGKN